MFLADGIPIVYYGEEQHYSGGDDPYNRGALWLSGFPTDSTLYKFISTTNNIRARAIAKDAKYITSPVHPFPSPSLNSYGI